MIFSLSHALEVRIGEIGTAIEKARQYCKELDLEHVWLIFNEVPLCIEPDNDEEVDEVWRRHMKLREDARRGRGE